MTERPRFIQERLWLPEQQEPQTEEAHELLHLALERYGLSAQTLRDIATSSDDITKAIREGTASADMIHLLNLVGDIFRPRTREQIRSPKDIAAYLMARYGLSDQEEFSVTSLDTKNRLLGTQTLYRGTVDSAQVRVAEVFKPAIRLNATSIILGHNHPSGAVTPSPEDILITNRIVDAGELLDCQVLDHIIIGQGVSYSLREHNLGGFK